MIDHNNYTNTVDVLGDDVLTDALITRAFPTTFNGNLIDDKACKIRAAAFRGCKDIVNVYFPLVQSIGAHAFLENNIRSVDFPECETVGQSAFDTCGKLTEVIIPKLRNIPANAFSNCAKLTEIHLPNVVFVNSFAFNRCYALEVIDLPGATNLEGSSFAGCTKLKTVELPSAVVITAPFIDCTSLEKVYLPAIERLGTNCFYGDSALQEVNLGPNITRIDDHAFNITPSTLVINIPVAEGAIAGAPWGASEGVTINYNTPYVGPSS